MKKQILTAVLFLFINNCFAQILYLDTISFEGGLHQLKIDTSQVNNIWQVGKPSKVIFNSAYSVQNAIVTDTLNTYPINNLSSFTFAEPMQLVNYFSFWHKYDTDSGHAGGFIEASGDGGNTWYNLALDPTVGWIFPFNMPAINMYDSTQKITGGIPAFTGKSNGWIYTEFNWSVICALQSPQVNSVGDSIWFRFSFKSDAVQTGKEGWMIDNIIFRIDNCSGIENINPDDFKIYPNPVSDKLSLQLSETQRGKIIFQIYDVTGREVSAQSEIINHKSEIDVSALQAGVYFLQVNEGENMMVKRFLKE